MNTFAAQIAPKHAPIGEHTRPACRGRRPRRPHPSGLSGCVLAGIPELRRRAFTLLELLVVLATLAILAAMLLPALARAKPNSHGMQCMSNQKQLTLAWLLYADDNGQNLPPNENGGSGSGTGTVDITKTWANGWLNWIPDNTDNTNLQFLANALLGNYLQRQTRAFKCPADIYTCVEGNKAMPRVRSVSMNGYIEGNAYLTAKGGLA
ncbi:MAG TPA: prepilin-type N-terminal cleavage/methylation domain-containing protein, partial [Verrucomicrobiae bacterium]|nr:prepilin-type N-terminal cleavage/methylation domain-containing protein [Verrucomicrobiae bacterium]